VARMPSQTYVALPRGINLGARNKISMADLRALFVALGHEEVATHLQSGNVIFRSPGGGKAADLIAAIERRIKRDLALDVTVLLRSKAQLAKIQAGNPFAGRTKDPTKLHVTLLADTPDRARVRDLDPKAGGPDEFRVVGREVYLHCPNGYGKSKLSNAYFEKQLGVVATTRNWRTVAKLAELTNASDA
jgi:uncharacterized protein (DUF1697 family)